MRQVTHALLTRPPLSHKNRHSEEIQLKRFARLACVRHAASVHPEPGSNSRKKSSLSVQEKLLAFPIPLLTVFGSASFDAFLWIILLKRIFRVVVYYLVIKVLCVSAVFDSHIRLSHLQSFVNSFFYFFLLSVFAALFPQRSLATAVIEYHAKNQMSTLIFEFISSFFLPRVIHTLSTSFPHNLSTFRG